jgi:hypothetical protein
MATQYAFGKIVTDRLVLALDAADRNSYVSSSTIWNDVSNGGYISSVTLSGDLSYSSFTNNSFYLSGASNSTSSGSYFIGLGNISETINNDFTTCGWINRTTSTKATILEYRGVGFRLEFLVNNTEMRFSQRNLNAPNTTNSTFVNSTNPLNTWEYYSLSKTGTSWSFYKNGVLVGTNTFTMGETISTGTRISIGIAWSDDDFFSNGMTGFVGAVSHYIKALSAQEIQQNYNAQKARFGLT